MYIIWMIWSERTIVLIVLSQKFKSMFNPLRNVFSFLIYSLLNHPSCYLNFHYCLQLWPISYKIYCYFFQLMWFVSHNIKTDLLKTLECFSVFFGYKCKSFIIKIEKNVIYKREYLQRWTRCHWLNQ